MRLIALILCAASALAGISSAQISSGNTSTAATDTVAGIPLAVFPDGVTLDLGKIRPDKRYHGELRIANAGDGPLIIKRVFTDCGCTAARYPREPIMPGDTAAIAITYDSSSRGIGAFSRVLRIEANTSRRRHIIFVNGIVKR